MLARFDRDFAEFLDHADVAPLVTPAFADNGRVEGHAEEPRALFAGRGVSQAIAADDATGELLAGFLQAVAAVVEFRVGGEVSEELFGGNASLVAEVREIDRLLQRR